MAGAGQTRPIIPLIATHFSLAFLAPLSPRPLKHLCVCVCASFVLHKYSSVQSHKHTLLYTNTATQQLLKQTQCKCSTSQSPRPASFVCPQLFRPVACIVLPGSLPGALWLQTSSLIGPERDREGLFLLRLPRMAWVVECSFLTLSGVGM